ncbi:molecular chaperone DnaJ [Salana multivorans]|uniref:Chaperone protein DnaJ n=1 Tax=Salana multivorans TaxID=120377 RepID=A0A3N2D0E0_9MICO|nr:molecular chaperone DnaJ [Salana multivorans]OJX94667.1 MAG: molecular chaperone DnaJ [Micrococcales bacterium 73-15]ROR93236.1 molecular chaperone DnaJ [Salana multivorans]
MTDYYEILGVSRDATTEEIKRAYRKLARQYHPDVAGEESAEKFKEVTMAAEVLTDPEKRRMYDLGGPSAFGAGGAGGPGMGGFGFGDLFETLFNTAGATARGPVPRSRRGQDALVRIDLDLAEAAFGVHRDLTVETAVVCGTCHGSCARPGTSPRPCSVCGGRGMVQRVARSFLGNVMTQARCDACQGYGSTIPEPCLECSGEGRVRTRRTIGVDVPAGVETGSRIKLTGQGEVGPGGGPAGDLYVEVRELPHPVFTRRGDDLHCTVSLPMTAAALGTVLTVESLDGQLDLDIAPGTQPDEVLTLRGKGMGRLRGHGRGDLHVHLDVQVPTKLDERQQELLRELAGLRGEESPAARLAPVGAGMFARLRDKLAGRS